MMLWLSKPLLSIVTDLLSQAPTGAVATYDAPRVHKALASAGTEVCQWSAAATDLAGVVIGGSQDQTQWESHAQAWHDSLIPGGILLWIDKEDPREASRRFLCGGLTDVSQIRVGRRLITSGRR